MSLDRRAFLHCSAAAGALLASGSLACRTSEPRPRRKLRVLVLGGTGFLGPAIVEACERGGHELTLFNRNRHNTHLFPHVERLKGDRDPDKDDGLRALGGRQWDVVFDDCGYYPRHVKASAELLAPNVGHYVYVSSISCYAKTDVEGMDEEAACAVLEDPTVETMGEGYANYGGLKALCEEAAEAALPGRTCVVRPGYIVGPTDPTDRFTYWPVRFDQGGDVLVPGAPGDPLQVIDVRDLASWMVLVAERGTVGRFNACGPAERLSWGRVIEACRKVASRPSEVHWIAPAEVEQHGLAFPIWAPYAGETRGFHTVANARAVAAGLTFRPIEAIVADTLAWFREQPPERREQLFERNLPAEREAEVLAALG